MSIVVSDDFEEEGASSQPDSKAAGSSAIVALDAAAGRAGRGRGRGSKRTAVEAGMDGGNGGEDAVQSCRELRSLQVLATVPFRPYFPLCLEINRF